MSHGTLGLEDMKKVVSREVEVASGLMWHPTSQCQGLDPLQGIKSASTPLSMIRPTAGSTSHLIQGESVIVLGRLGCPKSRCLKSA